MSARQPWFVDKVCEGRLRWVVLRWFQARPIYAGAYATYEEARDACLALNEQRATPSLVRREEATHDRA